MPSDLSGKYEVLLPVTTSEGSKAVGESVELSHEDAETFLRRGFVKRPENGSKATGKRSEARENSEV